MDVQSIAKQFAITGIVDSVKPLGDGFINDTYIIRTKGDTPDYILQRKNKYVFPDVPSMMDNIAKVTAHIRKKVIEAGGNPDREVMTVVPALDGRLYHTDSDNDFWAVSVFIPDTVAYNCADSPELARKGGQGIGKFQAQLSDFSDELSETIAGFHNIAHRFRQWDAAVAADKAGRVKNLAEEIGWIEQRRERMMEYRRLVDSGVIPTRVTHNDTKINNILFDSCGEVLCVIDLDTVMPAPIHNDFGDAIRTYANTGAEDDEQLERVAMSLEIFKAYADGYLSQQAASLTDSEIDYLAFSAIYITFEQVLRFLMDYIDGDIYYKIKSPDHNLQRTRAQYKLLTSMEEQYPQMQAIITDLVNKYRPC